MSGRNERKGLKSSNNWEFRNCRCGQRFSVLQSNERVICYTCDYKERRIRLVQATKRRYPYLRIPDMIKPMDKEMMEIGNDMTIREYCRMWAERTETGSFDMLVIDAARRVHKYLHMDPNHVVDYERYINPPVQLTNRYKEEDFVLDLREQQVGELLNDTR